MTNEFVDYLFYIGIINNENFQKFLKFFQNDDKTNNNNKQNLLNCLINYFKNLKINDLEILAKNIFTKFIENKNKIVNKFLKNISKIKNNLNLVILKKYFSKWNKKIESNFNSISSNFHKNKRDKMNKIFSNKKSNSVNFLTRLNNYNLKSEIHKNKILIQNFNIDEIQCTFNPNLNLTKNNYKTIKSKYISKSNSVNSLDNKNYVIINEKKKKLNKKAINKLYNDYKLRKEKKFNLIEKIDLEKGITYKPNLNLNNKYAKKIEGDVILRGQQMIKEKNDFIDSYNYLRDMDIKKKSNFKASGINIKKDELYYMCFHQNSKNKKEK